MLHNEDEPSHELKKGFSPERILRHESETSENKKYTTGCLLCSVLKCRGVELQYYQYWCHLLVQGKFMKQPPKKGEEMILCKNEIGWVSHCEHKNTRSRATRREAPNFWHTPLLPHSYAHDWSHHSSHIIPARKTGGSGSPHCLVRDPSCFPLPVENSYSHIHFLGWSTHIPLLRRYSSPHISDKKTELHIKHHGMV